jgi:hypothetical protein
MGILKNLQEQQNPQPTGGTGGILSQLRAQQSTPPPEAPTSFLGKVWNGAKAVNTFVSDVAKTAAATTIKTGLGLGKVAIKAYQPAADKVGLGQYNRDVGTSMDQGIESFQDIVPKNTTGEATQLATNVGMFFASPASKGATGFLPRVAAALPGAISDTAITAGQGGNAPITAGAGLTSLVANTVLPGPAKSVMGTLGRNFGTGYFSDVVTGLTGQRGEDRTGASALIPGAGTALGGLLGTAQGVAKARDPLYQAEKTVANRTKALNVLDDYASVSSKVQKYIDRKIDVKKIVANTDLLQGGVDKNGVISTKGEGEAIDQVQQFIKPQENVIRKNLEIEGVSLQPEVIQRKLEDMVNKSGLEGAALTRAHNEIAADMAGYARRANPDGTIPLTTIHDAKVDKYSNINFMTEAEKQKSGKAIAKGLKELVEKNTKSIDVKKLNDELSKHYAVIDYLGTLNGKRVEGGRLGKYFAKTVGAVVGGHFGPLGAIVGAEGAGALKGATMASTMGPKIGRNLESTPLMDEAVARGQRGIVLPPPLDLRGPQSSKSLGSLKTTQSNTTIPVRKAIPSSLPKKAPLGKAQPNSTPTPLTKNQIFNEYKNSKIPSLPPRAGETLQNGMTAEEYAQMVESHAASQEKSFAQTRIDDLLSGRAKLAAGSDSKTEIRDLLGPGVYANVFRKRLTAEQEAQLIREGKKVPPWHTKLDDYVQETIDNSPGMTKDDFFALLKKSADVKSKYAHIYEKGAISPTALATVAGGTAGAATGFETGPDGKTRYNVKKGLTNAALGTAGAYGAVVGGPKLAKAYRETPNKQGGFARVPGLGADKLTQEARKYKTAEEFVNAQGKPVYHGTTRVFTNFDISKTNAIRAKEFGTPTRGISLSSSQEIADRYAGAAQNKLLPIDAIKILKEKYPEIGRIAEKLYKYGDSSVNADEWIQGGKIGDKLGVDINIAYDVASAIPGSKISPEYSGIPGFGGHDPQINSANSALFRMKQAGIDTSKIHNRHTLEAYINPTARIYDIGYVGDKTHGDKTIFANLILSKKIDQAKKDGFDGVSFQTEQSVGNKPEIVVFDPSKIKTRAQLLDIYNKAHAKNATQSVKIAGKTTRAIDESTKRELVQAIDYLRIGKKSPNIEDTASRLAQKYGISEAKSNTDIANLFQDLIEKTKTLDTLPGVSQKPAIDKLTQEARKYKTAEEFVKTQKPLYHGTDQQFETFDKSLAGEVQPSDWGEGIYFTDNKENAKSFAQVAGGDIVMERYAPGVKFADGEKLLKDPDFMAALDDGMGFVTPAEYIAKKGYGGVKFTNPQGFTEYVVYDPENIKTNSQLTDIYNKAHSTSLSPQVQRIMNITK